MTQTALVATADDATVATLYDTAINHGADGVQLYTDVGNAPSSTEVAASTLFDVKRVKTINATQYFNALTLASSALLGYIPKDTKLMVEKLTHKSTGNIAQTLYKVSGGTYTGDYIKYEDVIDLP